MGTTSKADEKQKSFIDSQFFSSEFQSVGRIVKIAYSERGGPAGEGGLKTICMHLNIM